MTKICTIVVQFCNQCPHYVAKGTPVGYGRRKKSYCSIDEKNSDPDIGQHRTSIPDWCKLENKQTQHIFEYTIWYPDPNRSGEFEWGTDENYMLVDLEKNEITILPSGSLAAKSKVLKDWPNAKLEVECLNYHRDKLECSESFKKDFPDCHSLLSRYYTFADAPINAGEVIAKMCSTPSLGCGPYLGFTSDKEYALFVLLDDRSEDIVCQHKDWETFLELCSEYVK